MSTGGSYTDRADECLAAAENVSDPAERAALVKIAGCYLLLADYAAERQNHGTAHRDDKPKVQPDS
jgi:hypothetical protein